MVRYLPSFLCFYVVIVLIILCVVLLFHVQFWTVFLNPDFTMFYWLQTCFNFHSYLLGYSHVVYQYIGGRPTFCAILSAQYLLHLKLVLQCWYAAIDVFIMCGIDRCVKSMLCYERLLSASNSVDIGILIF